MRKTLAVGRKEFRQIARDRRSLMVLLFVPGVLPAALRLRAQLRRAEHPARRPRQRSLAGQPRAVSTRSSTPATSSSSADVSSSREYEELIDRGEVRAALVIPAGLQRDLLTGRRVPVQVIINGDNSNTATTVMGYALRILQTASAQYQLQASHETRTAPITVESRVWYNPQLRSALFLIPGLIAYIGMISAVDLDVAVGRARKRARHDGAGAHGAARHRRVHHRQDAAVLRHLARLRRCSSCSRRWCCSGCR